MLSVGVIIKLKKDIIGMLTKENIPYDDDSFNNARIFNFHTFKANTVLICIKTNYLTEFEACSMTVLYKMQLYDVILNYEKDIEVMEKEHA